ncbi:conserved hypothetical protein [Nostocoides japonicum T1-X7]|uniref:Endolytic murein transglycosylase n=1 Tax=Nostocoides japonicum T1-X7 TaxID=1194083 RepID=A0A077LWP8_9MICO|nr:endolytic transglycosylase MltG [Tetrasphaera japonica]CCH77252.1 conserved hypothetical protein [Tetrasphaera japonica T1-X7]
MSSHLEETIFGAADAHAGGGRRRRRPGRFLGRWLVLLLAVALLAGAAYGSYLFLKPVYDRMTAPKDYPGPGSGSVSVVIARGATGREIAKTLEGAGVVKTSGAFVDAEVADTKAAAAIQPGTYRLKREMKASDALVALGNPKNRTVAGVTIREGLWASEIYPILSRATGVPVSAYVAAARNPGAIGLPSAAKGNVEGYLYPDTYQFDDKMTATQQLREMVEQSVAALHKAGVPDAAMERTMTVASIVEAEVNQPSDRAKVSGVIENRLRNPKAEPAGFLQLDSTVSYAAKRRALTTTDKERANPSPYNTYVHKGLPPGPIGNPGYASIVAAAHPESVPYYYWLVVNPAKGHTEFSRTFAEHQQQVTEFQAWCRTQKKGTCS